MMYLFPSLFKSSVYFNSKFIYVDYAKHNILMILSVILRSVFPTDLISKMATATGQSLN
jgi:uncharacterized membrane protein YdjX (TVP38/TMEM64 family)